MGDASDLDQQMEQLKKCKMIKESDVKILYAKAKEILGMYGIKHSGTGFSHFCYNEIFS